MRFLMDHEGNIYPFRQVLHVDPINDMAIIRVDTNGRKLTPASIGTDVRRALLSTACRTPPEPTIISPTEWCLTAPAAPTSVLAVTSISLKSPPTMVSEPAEADFR